MHTLTRLRSQGASPHICMALLVYFCCTVNVSFLHMYAYKELMEIKTHGCAGYGITCLHIKIGI